MNKEQSYRVETSMKRSVLLVTAFASFLTPFLGSAINLALPAIGNEFQTTALELGWIVSSFILTSAIFLLPFGRLADIAGRKKIFKYGLSLFSLSTFLIIFSWNTVSLISFRILQGIAGAMIFGTSMAILTSVFEPGERGKAMGINTTAVYAGLSSGPVIGGLLTQHFGWRSIFLFLVPVGLTSLYLIFTRIKTEWSESKGEKFDWAGSFIYGISLASFMLGFSRLPSAGGFVMIGIALLLGLIFVFFEKNTQNPVFDIRLMLRNRVFAFSGIAALIHYSATSATGFFLSLYLQYLKGFDARTAGLILISQPLMMALLSTFAGKLSDRYNPGIIASYGMALTSSGLIMLCFINGDSPLIFIIILLAVMGIGFGLFASPNSNAIMSSVEKKHLGVASAVLGTMRMAGQMMSMGIAMMLLALYMGQQAIVPSSYPGLMTGMRTGFIIFSILCTIGIFASLARK